MKVSVTGIALGELDVDLLVVPVSTEALPTVVSMLEQDLGGLGRALEDFDASLDSVQLIYPESARAKRIVLTGMGPKESVDAEVLRVVGARGADISIERKAQTVALLMPETNLDAESASQALVEGYMLASYRFTRYKSAPAEQPVLPERLVLHARQDEKVSRRGAERGRVLAESVSTARDLVNLSPDEKTPTLLARAMERSAKRYGYSADVWDKSLIEEEQMGGLLAVNRGSTEPPTFTILTWEPDNAVNERPIILVGKGVTFDTGGLSLKPTKDSMDQMKADMAGAAAVIGIMEAVARLELPLYLMGLIPATDNRPGMNAYVPGDVIRMHSGKTVEVLDTDAEGRLILADALSYAKTYKPELVIDLATLTGAAVVALGSNTAAVMTNDMPVALQRLESIEAAGLRTGERVHRLPMYDEYADQLKSSIADLKNIGGREAGAITAAKFLEAFVSYPWIHLDIAGPAFSTSDQPYRPKGGTGFGVRLLVEYLREYASPRRKR